MAAFDGAIVTALVYAVCAIYALVVYDSFGLNRRTPELAGMLAAVFVFVNLMRGRYQLSNYLSVKRQGSAAIAAWTVTLLALVVFLFLAKIADQYSRGAIAAVYLVGIPVIAGSRSLLARAVAAVSRSGRSRRSGSS